MFDNLRKRLVRFLEDNRGLIIVLFCLPASFLWDIGLKSYNYILNRYLAVGSTHEDRTREIQRRVRLWNKQPESTRKPMCTARANWLSLSTTFFDKSQCQRIPVHLFNILELDEDSLTVRTEPMVSVADMVKFLVPKGYTLAVTLEFGDATVGGLAMATGMTTYSHKIGLYQESIVSYDVIIADGSLVHATADNEHSDLFYTLPWSHGTLGLLVALEIKLVRVKPYIHMRYIPVKGQKKYCELMRTLSGAKSTTQETPDYLEATVYSKEDAVVMVGNFADVKTLAESAKVNHVALWFKPWFYKHVESIMKTNRVHEEYIPLDQYLLRHNRAIFWVLESMIPFGNHPVFRFFLGWLCPPKPAFLKYTTTAGVRAMTFTRQVFQDIVLPMTVLEDSINLTEELFDTYPVLIYPCRVYDRGNAGQLRTPRRNQLTPGANYGMFYDLGVYGVPGAVKRRTKYNAAHAMRTMEKFIRNSGGYSFLYADIFMTRKEFEEMFDLTSYERVRRKYGANGAFPHLYDKVKPEVDVVEIAKDWVDCN